MNAESRPSEHGYAGPCRGYRVVKGQQTPCGCYQSRSAWSILVTVSVAPDKETRHAIFCAVTDAVWPFENLELDGDIDVIEQPGGPTPD